MSAVGRLGGSGLMLGPMGCLAKHKCPECGKEFECGAEWGYSHSKHNGRVYYCSYRCYRVWEREKQEKARQMIQRADDVVASAHAREVERRKKKRSAVKPTREEQCLEKIAYYAGLAELYPTGTRDHNNAMTCASVWRRKLKLCRKGEGKDDG